MMGKREANFEFMRRRQKRLRENRSALKWLHKQRIDDDTIKFFKLGLADLYQDKYKDVHENALLAPLLNENGIFTKHTVYLNIPSAETRKIVG